MQGLMAALAARHDITAVSLITPELDARAAQRAMREYCREVGLVPARPRGAAVGAVGGGPDLRGRGVMQAAPARPAPRRFHGPVLWRHQLLPERGWSALPAARDLAADREEPPARPAQDRWTASHAGD